MLLLAATPSVYFRHTRPCTHQQWCLLGRAQDLRNLSPGLHLELMQLLNMLCVTADIRPSRWRLGGGRRERKPSASAAGWVAPQAAANPFSRESSAEKSTAAHVCSALAPFWAQRVWSRSDVEKRWRRGQRCDVAAMKGQRLILKRAAGL